MFRLNAKCLGISLVVFSCLAIGSLARTDRPDQKKLSALEDTVGKVSGSVSTDMDRSVDRATPPGRLAVAILWFADETGNPQMAHWRYTVEGLLTNQLWKVKAIRSSGGVGFARRELGISKGAVLDAGQTQKIGEIVEAQRIVWGSYRRENEQWKVRAFVLNVASGKVSSELVVVSADWFEVGDRLTEQVLNELRIKPSEEERQKMLRRWTTSPSALEWYSKALALQEEGKPFSEQEACVRKAIAADPQYARAYGALASILGSQGKFAQAEEAVRQALKIRPDSAGMHALLGNFLCFQKKFAEAEKELREAHRLDPDSTRSLSYLGQFYSAQGKWDEAIAFFDKVRLLDPTDAFIHASLGLMYAYKRDRNRAMAELREAERLDPEGYTNAAQMICQAYELLGEIPLAVEHYERFVSSIRKQGGNPEIFSAFDKRAQRLKATLTPTFIETTMPKIYTEQALQAALAEKLTKDELDMVVNPVASSAEIKRWAQQLTKGADSDLDKAKVLFDGLTRRIQPEGAHGMSTAREVFAAWSDPNDSFSCQEYAKLFIALARDVGLEAFCVHVEKDYREKVVFHDCAAVFVQGKALLVDPAYRWFGVLHKEFVILDDVQTIAHHFFQHRRNSRNVSRCRLAAKLHPDFAWGQFCLANVLRSAGQWEEARKVLDVLLGLDPDRWDAHLLQGAFEAHDGNWQAAADYFRKALESNPESTDAHFNIAVVLKEQGKLKEAREEYRACLRYEPEPGLAGDARHEIAQINELIGVGQTSPADLTLKDEYDLAISEYTKALEINPKDAGIYNNRGIAYAAKGLCALAISDFDKALEINPKYAGAYSNRGSTYFKKGQVDRAISDFSKALEINPKYAEAYSNRGATYFKKGQMDRAISDFNKTLEIDSADATAYSNRGAAYVEKGEYDIAISDCNKAIEINPGSAEAYSNRAKAYHKKGLNDQAISDCNKAIEINPRLADAYRNRGFARTAKGDFDGAILDFNKFQELSK